MEEIREETKAQKEIAAYISRNNISASEVARKTKVDVGLLTGKAERKRGRWMHLKCFQFVHIWKSNRLVWYRKHNKNKII